MTEAAPVIHLDIERMVHIDGGNPMMTPILSTGLTSVGARS